MLDLVAEYGDTWNWWTFGETISQMRDRLTPIIDRLQAAYEGLDRDPSTLERTLDVYTVVPEGHTTEGLAVENAITGKSSDVADQLLDLTNIGIDEVGCDI